MNEETLFAQLIRRNWTISEESFAYLTQVNAYARELVEGITDV